MDVDLTAVTDLFLSIHFFDFNNRNAMSLFPSSRHLSIASFSVAHAQKASSLYGFYSQLLL